MKPDPQTVATAGAGEAAGLLTDLRQLIAQSRQQLAVAVNAGLTLLYWQLGQRIHRELLGGERAGYGEAIVSTVSRQLTAEYGRSFSAKSLRHMVRFGVSPVIRKTACVRNFLECRTQTGLRMAHRTQTNLMVGT